MIFGSTSVSTAMAPQLTLYLNSKLTYYLETGPLGSNLLLGLQQRERKNRRKGWGDLLLGEEMGRVPNEEHQLRLEFRKPGREEEIRLDGEAAALQG